MNRYKKLASNSIIFAIGNLGSKFIQFILVPLYTYTLTRSEFGKVDLITSIINLVGVLLTLDIADGLFRFAMDKELKKDQVFSTGILLACFSICIGAALVPFFAILKTGYPILLSYLFLATFTLYTCISNYVRAVGFSKLFATAGIISTLVTAVSNIVFLVIFKQGINGYLLSLVIANLIAGLFLILTTGTWKSFGLKKFNWNLMKKMLVYSIPLIPNSIAWWLNSSSDRFFIVLFLGATANGLYAVANKIPSLLTLVTSVFMQSWQISTVEEYSQKDRNLFFSKIFKYFSNFLFAGSIVILLFLKPILKYMVSPIYYESWKVVPFLMLAVIYSSLAGFLGTMYTASKKTVPVMVTTIFGAFINVIFTIILVPLLGLNGAAVANVVSFVVVFLLRLKDMYKFDILRVNLMDHIYDLLLFMLTLVYLYLINDRIYCFFMFLAVVTLCVLKNAKIIVKITKTIFQRL